MPRCAISSATIARFMSLTKKEALDLWNRSLREDSGVERRKNRRGELCLAIEIHIEVVLEDKLTQKKGLREAGLARRRR